MMQLRTAVMATCLAMAGLAASCTSMDGYSVSKTKLHSESSTALTSLYENNPAAAAIAKQARSVLIFPDMVKAGFGVGGAYGEGEHRRSGVVVDRYNSVTGSWGLQAGAQSYGYAVFLMNAKAEAHLENSDGWELGVGPTVVLVNAGVAENLSTTTLNDDAYAFIFDQKGLMAGVSIEGTKITRVSSK